MSADLVDDAVDLALEQVKRLGVPAEDVVLVRLESIGASVAQRPLANVVWSDLLSQAGANAARSRATSCSSPQREIIAAFGVIYQNVTLVVGAMAISPDTLPTAAATALVLLRSRLAGRAVVALVLGLAVVCAVGGVMTGALNALDLLPKGNQDQQQLPGRSLDGQHLDADRRLRRRRGRHARVRDAGQLSRRSSDLGDHDPGIGLSGCGGRRRGDR